MNSEGKFRLAYVVSHPIQYQAPLLRRLAQEPDIALSVLFWSDFSSKAYRDEGFGGIEVKWDVPLLDGYEHEFLPAIRSATKVTFWAPINRGIYKALKKGRFDAVWLHGYWNINSVLTMVAAKRLGIPLLQRAEGTLIDRERSAIKRGAKRAFFSIAKHFIRAVLPIGSRNREYWAHYLGADFPAFMMPYAVDNEYFQRKTAEAGRSREEFRQSMELKTNRPVILYASKLISSKRCIDLIDAHAAINPMADGSKPYLLIVGDGPDRASLEARVREYCDSSVRFFGFQNQSALPRFYDLCDVFVLPSEAETFGLIVNEVMNAGRPVVVSGQVGCQPDLVCDWVNGRTYPAGNVDALRRVLESVLRDPEVGSAMGLRSRERINEWSYEEDICGLRMALNYVAGLPVSLPQNSGHKYLAANVMYHKCLY